jgi:predicted DCC family thiol-disulfide oxidoreductase YuxK
MSLNNGWTGGQYSLFRVVFGIYLFVHFVHLIPWGAELFSDQGVIPQASASPMVFLFPNVLALWDSPVVVTIVLLAAAGLSFLFTIGWYDRLAAVGIWYIWACLFGRNPLIANPGLPYVGWMLLAHACLPSAPYGSWTARGRPDPGNAWRMPDGIYMAAWVVMAVGYSYSGIYKLTSPSWLDGSALMWVMDNPLARPGLLRDVLLSLSTSILQLMTWGALGLEISFAPLALLPRLRPWVWGAMLAMHIALMSVIDFADLSLGMVMLHFFTFDPAWVRPRKVESPELVFYDGHCGLCHRSVRFLLAEDHTGEAFRFAPLESDTFSTAFSEATRATLPDSLVVRTTERTILTRSASVLHILQRLGGLWRVLGIVVHLIPLTLRDKMYDGIARVRHRLFQAPAESCPIIPANLRVRFMP